MKEIGGVIAQISAVNIMKVNLGFKTIYHSLNLINFPPFIKVDNK